MPKKVTSNIKRINLWHEMNYCFVFERTIVFEIMRALYSHIT